MYERSLAWLSSERLYQQVPETDADTGMHRTEVRDHYGRLSRRIEGIEGNGKHIRRPTVSTNPDPWKLPDTELQTKLHTLAGLKPPVHI